MKIYSEGFRRVTAEGEFEANQNSKLKFGVLISVACISSLAFTSKAEGVSFTPNNAGGKSEVQILADFKDWACNVLTDPTLCDQYGNTTNLDDIDIDDLIEFKDSNNIEDAVQGDLTLFSKIEVSHIIEHRTIDSHLGISSSVIADVEFSRQVSSKIDLIALTGQATWEEVVLWNTIEDNWGELVSVNKPKIATQYRDATSIISITFDGGSANWESPVVWENMDVYWDAPEGTNTPYLAKVYERDASSSISLSASVGTADYASSVFWEFMDVNWDDEDTSTSNQFFSTVHNRNASAGISISTTVGQAGWASDFVWEGLDVNWDDEVSGQFIQGNVNTSFNLFGTSSFVLADLENRTASANIEVSSSVTFNVIRQRTATSSSSFSMTVGSAGWVSDLIWEQADVEWHLTSGQLIQEGASSSLSLSTNVSGEIDTIFAINASSQFSLSTNINSEKIAGWNSDTTLIENSTRNWETS